MATSTTHDDHAHEEHALPTGWRRYLYSTNHKDIGTLYLIFAIVAGVIGFLLSFAIRLELQNPGIQIFPTIASWLSGDSSIDAAKNLYNVFITGHGVIMIFFFLVAAIPAMVAYNKFISDSERYANRLDGFSDEFSAILSRQIDERGGR